MDRRKIYDTIFDESACIVDWDFRNCSASEFKKNYKREIQKPLSKLLRDFYADPKVQMPEELKEAMLGIIRSLINYYVGLASQPSFQKTYKLRERIGDQSTPKAAWIHFSSITNLFKTCMSIMNPNKPSNPFQQLKIEPFQNVMATFNDPAFSTQRKRVQMGLPGHYPLLISWRINELVPTTLPDIFMETKIVSLSTDVELKTAPNLAPVVSYDSILFNSLMSNTRFHAYASETCASCDNSGVKKLRKCSVCKVAMYCGEKCSKKHWSVHKHDCDDLRNLRIEALVLASLIDFPEESYCVYARGNCASCDKPPTRGNNLSKCTVCKVAKYCGRECQVNHWKEHKHHCKRLSDHRAKVSKKAMDEEAV